MRDDDDDDWNFFLDSDYHENIFVCHVDLANRKIGRDDRMTLHCHLSLHSMLHAMSQREKAIFSVHIAKQQSSAYLYLLLTETKLV